MNVQEFLAHHGVARNPFSEEDASTDPVFKEHCIGSTYHPTWDKVYGNPADPSTAVVFGEKGAGKTAMRLQIREHLKKHNRQHPDRRVYVIEYDDFNPFLDRFRDKLSPRKRKPEKMLGNWKLWDHMDGILSIGVTDLVDRVLNTDRRERDEDDAVSFHALDQLQARDLLLLAACYDQSLSESFVSRWHRLRKKLRYNTIKSYWQLAVGCAVTLVSLIAFVAIGGWGMFLTWYMYAVIAAGWLPFAWKWWKSYRLARGIHKQVRVVHHDPAALRKVFGQFTNNEIAGQPLPNQDRTDDRYELLVKLQGILRTLGYSGVIVLVDRVDEPHVVNGSIDKMKALLWPLLDNKLLKHPGVGFKLLLPVELVHYIERESKEFYQRARLDKQNMVPSLEWTGEALYDVANARVAACATNGKAPNLRDFFDDAMSEQRLMDAFRGLRVPRHLFKFLYRVIVQHGNAHRGDRPVWKISPETFESVLAVYRRDQDKFDRGMGAG